MTAHICTDIQAYNNSLVNPPPCFLLSLHSVPFYMTLPLFLLTWKTSFFCSWCEYPSTLVPGLLSTVLPLLLHPPQDTPQIKLHIYIDEINNVIRSVWHTYFFLFSVRLPFLRQVAAAASTTHLEIFPTFSEFYPSFFTFYLLFPAVPFIPLVSI